jgi:hypothetical protein
MGVEGRDSRETNMGTTGLGDTNRGTIGSRGGEGIGREGEEGGKEHSVTGERGDLSIPKESESYGSLGEA